MNFPAKKYDVYAGTEDHSRRLLIYIIFILRHPITACDPVHVQIPASDPEFIVK